MSNKDEQSGGVNENDSNVEAENVVGRDIKTSQNSAVAIVAIVAVVALVILGIVYLTRQKNGVATTQPRLSTAFTSTGTSTQALTQVAPVTKVSPSPSAIMTIAPSPTVTTQVSPTFTPTRLSPTPSKSAPSREYINFFDFISDLNGWQNVRNDYLVSGYKGNGIQLKNEITIFFRLPKTYKQGQKFFLFAWCSSSTNDKCKIGLIGNSSVGINANTDWEVNGSNGWQWFQTPVLALPVDMVIQVVLYAPTTPNGIVVYDEVEMFEVP